VNRYRPEDREVFVARLWLRPRRCPARGFFAALPVAALSCHDAAMEQHGTGACDSSHPCRAPYLCVDGRCAAPTAGAGGVSTDAGGEGGDARPGPSGAAGTEGIAGASATSGVGGNGGVHAAGAAGVPDGPAKAGDAGAESVLDAGAAGVGGAQFAGNAGAANGAGVAGQQGGAAGVGATEPGGAMWAAGFAGTAATDGGAGAAGAAGAAGVASEACNFRDDDGDGEVDEGFDWVVGPWRTLFSTNEYATYPEAITLSDGRVAISVGDSYGGGHDRGGLAVLSAEGELLDSPVWTDIQNSGVEYTSVAAGPGGEVAVLFSSTDYAGCSAGCPVTLARFDGGDLQRLSTDILALPFSPSQAQALIRTPSGYVTVVKDRDNELHMTWLDDASRGVTVDRAFAGSAAGAISVALGPAGIAWWRMQASTYPNGLAFGIMAADGSGVVLGETEILVGGGSTVAGDGSIPSLLAVDDDFVAPYFNTMATDQPPRLLRLDRTGATTAGPVAAGATESFVRDLALVEDNIVVLAASIDAPTTATLHRFRADLAPVAGASAGDLAFSVDGYLTMTSTSAGLVLVDGVSYSKQFRSALVHCP